MITPRILSLILSLAMIGSGASASSITKPLAPGVTLTQEIDTSPPLIINVLKVDLGAPGIRLGIDIGLNRVNGPDGQGGRETVSMAAQRHGALAAVNGDFFGGPDGDPLGVGIKGGQLFSEPWWGDSKAGPRAAMAVVDEGHRVIFDTLGYLGDLQAPDGARAHVAGVNRRAGPGEIIAYTPLYGPATGNRPGGTEVTLTGLNGILRANKLMTGQVLSVTPDASSQAPILPGEIVLSGAPGAGAEFLSQHFKPGDRAEFVLAVAPPASVPQAVQIAEMPRTAGDLPSRSGEDLNRSAWLWGTTRDAIGGGPRLLTDGQVTIDGAAEGFADWFVNSNQPRTAVGTTEDGQQVIIVTVDGRQPLSQGVTLPEMAQIMERYGAWNAINLDGGGSTAMAAGGLVVSCPPGDGSERRVAETLEVFSNRVLSKTRPAPPQMRLAIPTQGTVAVGSVTAVSVIDGARVIPGASPDILWQGPASGTGFLTQQGQFIAEAPGQSAITAVYKGYLVTGRITVTGPSSAHSIYTLSAEFAPGGASNYDQLTIHVLDQNGKPPPAAPVHLLVVGGVADAADVTTGPDGYVNVGITWQASHGGSVVVSSGDLKSITVRQPSL